MKRLNLLIALAAILAAGNAYAKDWQLIKSFSGRPAGISFGGSMDRDDFIRGLLDFDGDGLFDTATYSRNGGLVIRLNTFSETGPEIVRPCPAYFSAMPASGDKLMGFFNFDGTVDTNTPKEIVFALKEARRYINPVVLYNIDLAQGTCGVRIWDQGVILLGGWDTDNDGTFELILADPNKNEVQVWGLR